MALRGAVETNYIGQLHLDGVADDVKLYIARELRAAARQPAVQELVDRLIGEKREAGKAVLEEEVDLVGQAAAVLLVKLQGDIVEPGLQLQDRGGLHVPPDLAQFPGLVVAVGRAVERADAEAGERVEMQALPDQLGQHAGLPGPQRAAAAKEKAHGPPELEHFLLSPLYKIIEYYCSK